MTSAIAALFGLVVGSFLNVVIDRVPAGKSIVSPPSHCDSCQRPIPLYDNLPIVSYLVLRGRCRHCTARIPVRVALVEAATGGLFALVAWRVEPLGEMVFMLCYTVLLIPIFVIDLEQRIIPNVIVYPGILLALGGSYYVLDGEVWRAAAGLGVGLAIMLGIYLAARGGFGEGDVRMGAMMGAMNGLPIVFVSLLLGILSSGLLAVLLLALRLRKRKDVTPFGPFLAGGTFIALLWGHTIWVWYRGIFS